MKIVLLQKLLCELKRDAVKEFMKMKNGHDMIKQRQSAFKYKHWALNKTCTLKQTIRTNSRMLNNLQSSLHYHNTLIQQCSQHSSQPLILNLILSINQDRGASFINNYNQLSQEDIAIKELYFKVLVQIHNFCQGEGKAAQIAIIRHVLNSFIQQEQYQLHFVNLVPTSLFLQSTNFNAKTFERKQKRVEAFQENINNSNIYINDNTQAYSEIIVHLNYYLTMKEIKLEHTWGTVLKIAVDCQLDLDRITEIVVQLILVTSDEQKIVELCSLIERSKLLLMLHSKIAKGIQNETGLQDCGDVKFLVNKSPEELFKEKIFKYNPKHIKAVAILIHNNLCSWQEIGSMVPCTNSLFYSRLNKKWVEMLEEKGSSLFYKSTDIPSSELNSNSNDLILLKGQITNCFKLSLVAQFVAQNKFEAARDIYQNLSSNKINVRLYAPLLTVLCRLVEWIIDPYMDSRFPGMKKSTQNSFPHGSFQQTGTDYKTSLPQVKQLMWYIDINIGLSTSTFVKVCRFFMCILELKDAQAEKDIMDMIGLYLLGGMQLQDLNHLLVIEMQTLIFKLPQKKRFTIFNFYESNVLFQNIDLFSIFVENKLQSQIQRNLNYQIMAQQQNNHPFRCCHYFTNYIWEQKENKESLTIHFMDKSHPLMRQVMLYYCLKRIINHQHLLMMDYDEPSSQFRCLLQFIMALLRKYPETDLTFLLDMTLIQLQTPFQELAPQQQAIPYNRNFIFLKIVQNLLEQILPYRCLEMISRDNNQKQDFLLYGYHMKLEMINMSQSYHMNTALRAKFYQKLTSAREVQNRVGYTYLFFFLRTLHHHLKMNSSYYNQHQQGASRTLQKHIKAIDECILTTSHLINLICLQKNVLEKTMKKDQSSQINVQLEIIPPIELQTLVIEDKLELAPICAIYRELFKQDFLNNNFKELKSLWGEMMVRRFTEGLPQQFPSLKLPKIIVKTFVSSDFFFFFWMSNNPQLNNLEQKYCSQLTLMRRKLNPMINDDRNTNFAKECLKSSVQNIVDEKEDCRRFYQRFTHQIFVGKDVQLQSTKISKFSLPPEYESIKSKLKIQGDKANQNAQFIQFINLFFTYCILPRLVSDPSEALYCSKFILNVIQENKLPSNRALIMIFSAVGAVIDYTRYCTQRQASKCIPVFLNDLLKLFKNWFNQDQLSLALLKSINMQKFNDVRYSAIKKFMFQNFKDINKKLLQKSQEPSVAINVLFLIQKTTYIPLTYEQGQQIINFYKQIQQEECFQNFGINLKQRIQKVKTLISNRMKTIPSISTQNYKPSRKQTEYINLEDPRVLANLQPVDKNARRGVKRQM